MSFWIHTAIAAPLALSLITPALATPSFTGLGDLPGGDYHSQAADVSADGTTVVGHSRYGNDYAHAFRWTVATGLVDLGDLHGGGFGSYAYGVSGDGNTVVGHSIINGSWSGDRYFPGLIEPFRWTIAEQMQPLGFRDLFFHTTAHDVSENGAVAVGEFDSRPVLWDAVGDMISLAPDFWTFGVATGVSGDGTLAVGSIDMAQGTEAFLWVEAEGTVTLGDLPGGAHFSFANAISADGTTIVGKSESAQGHEAFTWTQTTGMVGLGDLPGNAFASNANAVSNDGSIVVGVGSTVRDGILTDEAFIWDETHGMRSLQTVLTEELGLDLSGWRLVEATGISADGTVIVGYGINPDGNTEAWIIYW